MDRKSSAPIDLSVLDELARATSDGLSFLLELISIFQEDAPVQMATMEQALSAGDQEGLRRAAHTLKGNAAEMGAHALSEAARAIEVAASSGELAAASLLLPSTRAELARVQAALREVQAFRRLPGEAS